MWGERPHGVVVVHGGPGAAGSVAPVARELSRTTGVLEPFQTRDSVQGQIDELEEIVERYGAAPVVMVGHSWGAWLALMTAAHHPGLVRKLVLVGCGPFCEKDAEAILPERLKRLSERERVELFGVVDIINGDTEGDRDAAMARFGELCARADTYDALPPETDAEHFHASEEINRRVWAEASRLRSSGELLRAAGKVRCPVTAIHGDYDPHPAEGVRAPLAQVLPGLKFIVLARCGHEPWRERYARSQFFQVLQEELRTQM